MAERVPARVYRKLVSARIKSNWQYRTSFLMLMAAQTLIVSLEFLAIVFVLELVPDLGGWTAPEVIFLYAMATVPFVIADLLVGSSERTSQYVQAGTFDRILLRPLPSLLQLWALEFELRRVGKIIPKLAIGGWAVATVDIVWTGDRIAVLVMALICGVLIYSSLWVATASFAFWAVATKEATNAVTYGGQSANEYPLHLYQNWIRATLGWGIPLAFVAYVPAQWLLDATNPLGLSPQLVYLTPVIATALVVVAAIFWSTGIRHYQSTGS